MIHFSKAMKDLLVNILVTLMVCKVFKMIIKENKGTSPIIFDEPQIKIEGPKFEEELKRLREEYA